MLNIASTVLVLLLRGYYGHIGPFGYFINGIFFFILIVAWIADKVEEMKKKYQRKKLVKEYTKQLVDKAGYTLEDATETASKLYYGSNYKRIK
jgi:hypothetical protein